MNINQLKKLAKNPNYKLSGSQIAELEEQRTEEFKQKQSSEIVRHDTKFKKHNPNIPEEKNKTKKVDDDKRTN